MTKDKQSTKAEQAKVDAETRVAEARETAQADQPTTNDLVQMQAPALVGAPEVEIAKRSQGSDAATDDRFRKTFAVLPYPAEEPVPPAENDQLHEANKLEVLNQAIQQGLHPDAEATFDGSEQHWDGKTVLLHYSVAVTPASVDSEASSTVTPHRVLTERLDGSTSNAEANTNEAEVTRESTQPTE